MTQFVPCVVCVSRHGCDMYCVVRCDASCDKIVSEFSMVVPCVVHGCDTLDDLL